MGCLGQASQKPGGALPDSPRVPSLCTWSLGQPASCGPGAPGNTSAQRGHHTHHAAPPSGQTTASGQPDPGDSQLWAEAPSPPAKVCVSLRATHHFFGTCKGRILERLCVPGHQPSSFGGARPTPGSLTHLLGEHWAGLSPLVCPPMFQGSNQTRESMAFLPSPHAGSPAPRKQLTSS